MCMCVRCCTITFAWSGFFFLMIRRPPRSTRTDTLCPSTTLFRSLGFVAAKDPAQQQAITDAVVTWGLNASPFDCWLAERGLHTFELRFERAQANAKALADHLRGLKGVKHVLYPGEDDHPDRDLARDILLLSSPSGLTRGSIVPPTLGGASLTLDARIKSIKSGYDSRVLLAEQVSTRTYH